jgi:membrane glycosyltransferase
MDGGLTTPSGLIGTPVAGIAGAISAMPPPHPVHMPEQPVSRKAAPSLRAPPTGMRVPHRRVLVLGGAMALACAAIYQMSRVLEIGGMTPVEVVLLVLFSLTFSWVGLTLVTAVAGLAVRISRRRPDPDPDLAPVEGKTAVVMPAYNEQPERIFAAIETMALEVARLGSGDRFDWFILSDTTDPDVALKEEAAFFEIRRRLCGIAPVYYRRRRKNVARKPGNIADFCKRWGGAYDYMLVLDADSAMEGETIVELARRMDRNPRAGIIQTVPRLVAGRTLLSRLQQFAGCAYGASLAAGLAWWTGTEGNYWGHNAILRMTAFTAAAGLPMLDGKPPFGGHILSHDFVEAALIRRAGWSILIADDLDGSYEEGPPSIADLATRDRRWCQGNLQHARLIGAPGLHWVSRFHLFTGIMSYVASPLWLSLILAGLALGAQARFTQPDYFPDDFNLFPTWPVIDSTEALWLLGLTMGVVFAVKMIGWIDLTMDARRNSGRGLRGPSIVLELVLSALLAPVLMVIQTGLVFSILSGSDRGWSAQRREAGSQRLASLFRDHRGHMASGAALGAVAWFVAPTLLLWLSPAIVCLLLAVPVSAACASTRLGEWLKRRGFLIIPEEVEVPRSVRAAAILRNTYSRVIAGAPDLDRLLADAELRSDHIRLTEPAGERQRGEVEPLEAMAIAKISEARSISEALSWLGREERAAVIGDPHLLERLARLPAA